MSTSDDTNTSGGGRIFQFPRLGFTLPGTPDTDPDNTPDTGPEPVPASGPGDTDTLPDWDAVTVNRTGRRSPLDIVNALPAAGLNQPILPPAPMLAPAPGHVPDTFRSPADGGDMVGPRMGALSLAAILAVAVAALRGTATYLTDRRQRRLAAAEEAAPLREARRKHQLAMQQHAFDAQQAGAKQAAKQKTKNSSRVPSSTEFGRKTLSNRSGSSGSGGRGSGGSSGGGAGRSNSTKKPHTGNGNGPAGRKNGPGSKGSSNTSAGGSGKRSPLGGGLRKTKPGNSNGSGGGKTLKKHDTPRTPKPKTPHRPTQSGSRTGLDKQRTKNNRGDKHDTGSKDGKHSKRRSLPDALAHDTHKAARKRLKQRRRNQLDNPVLWKNTRAKNQRDKTKKTPKTNTPAGGPDMRRLNQAAWHDLKQAAARRWKKRRTTTPPLWGDPKKASRKAQADDASTRQTRARRRNHNRWAKARDYLKNKTKTHPGGTFPGTPGGPGPSTAGPQPGSGRRRSPFEHAAHAAGTTYTVTSEHVPGSRAKRWNPTAIGRGTPTLPSKGPAALEQAPTQHTARPGTTRPKEPIAMPPVPARREDPRITRARNQAARAAAHTVGRQMDSKHDTEITLDDACDAADELTADCFTTHDQTSHLAVKARSLRDTWIQFADELATEHNLVGALFTGAAIKFGESMDLVARMADEMKDSSLEAAEFCETAGNELNDAYRPITQATADAGLTTPSAPVHNAV